jgi:DNA-binding winged helix-turn-helix (wHTH) protein/tetratricopeptide (TPR) repeat protein/TolB-like protein
MPLLPSPIYRFGRFEFDPARRALTHRGLKVRLPEQSLCTLLKLVERPGEIVTREELRQAIWADGTHVEFEGSLNAIVKRLRAALRDDAENPRFIETLPRRGYRFIAPVSLLEPPAPPAASPGSESAPSTPTHAVHEPPIPALAAVSPGKRISPWLVASLSFLVLASAATFFLVRRHRPQSQPSTAQKDLKVDVPASRRRSVAVLGFRNLSAKTKDAWLATALTEMFSTELAVGDKLRLVPGEEVARLQLDLAHADTLARPTTSRLAQALDADVLVLGSYATISAGRGRQIRLDVRLQDAKTSDILFETAQTGRIEDVFQLVSHAGDQMRDRLGISPVRQEDEVGLLASLPVNADAARFYALGIARLRAFDPLRAKDLLVQATEAEPRFALAHSMLAEAWQQLGYQSKGIAEAQKALSLSATLPQSQKLEIEGKYYESRGRTGQAAAVYRALFAFYPDCLDCGLRLASAEMQAGQLANATATIRKLRQLPSPQSDDPRIDFIEQSLVSYSDRPRQLVLLERTIQKAKARGLLWLYARARLAECADLGLLGKTTDAMSACQEAGGLFISLGDQMGVVRALILQAARQSDSGDQQRSLATFHQALQIARRLGGVELAAAVLNGIGNTLERMNHLEDSAGNFREARLEYQEAGDVDGIYATSVNLGDVLAGMGLLRQANDAYQQGLDISLAEAPAHSCYAQYSLASLRLTMGDLHDAQARIAPALKACAAQGIARYNAFALGILGNILREQGHLSAARETQLKALQIYQQSDSQDLMPGSWGALGTLAMDENDLPGAERFLQLAATSLRKQNSADGLAGVQVQLSRLYSLQGKPRQAAEVLAEALQSSRSLHDPVLNLSISIQDARLRFARAAAGHSSPSSLKQARAELQAVLRTSARLGFYREQCEARLAFAEWQLHTNPAAARASLTALSKETHDRGFELLSRKAMELLAHPPNTWRAPRPPKRFRPPS